MNRFAWLSAIALIVSVNTASAGQFNQVLDVGDAAPAWIDLIGVDDKKHSLTDLQDHAAVIVVFTCNSCPYAVDVEDRLNTLHKKMTEQNVAIVAINVNKVEEDLLPAMKARAKEKQFAFPYLFDESQQIAREYGATYTPEFYLLDRNRRVVYMGSMDDSPDGRNVTKRYLESAADAMLAGEKVEVTETPPVGCRVRYERLRRRRKGSTKQ